MSDFLKRFRSKNPELSEMDDQTLAEYLYNKHYTDNFDNFSSFANKIKLQGYDKPAPAGTEVVERFTGGGMIVKMPDGAETYFDEGFSTTDPARIAQIRAAKGDVGSVVKGETAQELIGELPTRVLSAAKGMPFVRGYVEPVAGQLASTISKTGIPYLFEGGEGISPEAATGLIGQAIERREQEAPITSGASRLATGVATAAPFAPALRADSMVGKIGQGGLYGTTLGGLEGLIAGYGEGGVDEAQRQATSGAVGGGLFGAAGAPIAGAVGYGYGKYLERPVKDIIESLGFKREAASVVADTLAKDAADAVQSVENSGPYGSLVAVGPNTASLLDTISQSSGKGAKIATDNLNETAVAASNDLNKTLDTVLGEVTKDGGIKTQKSGIMESTREERQKIYGEAYSVKIDPDTEKGARVIELVNRASPEELSQAKKALRRDGVPTDFLGGQRVKEAELNEVFENIPASQRADLSVTSNADGSYTVFRVPTVEMVDVLSRRLFGLSDVAKRAGDMSEYMSLRKFAFNLRKSLDDVSPSYKDARAVANDVDDMRNAADLGDNILNPKVTREDVMLSIENMDDVSVGQLRQALRNRIDEIAANAKKPVTASSEQEIIEALATLKAMNTRAVATKLRMVLGDEDADIIGKQIRDTSEAMMMRALASRNSATFNRQVLMERLKEITGKSLAEEVGEQGLLTVGAKKATEALVGSTPQSQRIERLTEEMAPVLTQRMTPEQLLLQASRLQSLAPAIERAQAGRQSAAEAVQRGAMSLGIGQAQQDERLSPTQQLMRALGMPSY
jgi:hypothetical protein